MTLLKAEWPAPANVRALMTTRAEPSTGGEGEDRAGLVRVLKLPSEPIWLRQVHGTTVVALSRSAGEGGERSEPGEGRREAPEGDASYTTAANVVCVAQAADCLPVVFCNDAGTVVAAAHAGWRGLCAGVLEATVRALPEKPEKLMAWMGAAIGPRSFEVGAEVCEAFVAKAPDAAQHFHSLPRHSRPPRHSRESGNPENKYLADLYGLARQRLAGAGVLRVFGGGFDTFADPARFHSFRRDGRCGRQCALIWRR